MKTFFRMIITIAVITAFFKAFPQLAVDVFALALFFGLPVICMLKIAFRTRPLRLSGNSFTKRR